MGSPVAEIRKVASNSPHRGGVLGMASVLTATSLPLRTGPAIRGSWVLTEVLGTPTPAPPMNVPQLPEDDRAIEEAFLSAPTTAVLALEDAIREGVVTDRAVAATAIAARLLWHDLLPHILDLFRRTTLPALPTNRFNDVAVAPDGELWVVSELGHVVRWNDGAPDVYDPQDDLPGVAETLDVRAGLIAHTRGGLVQLTPEGPVHAFPDAGLIAMPRTS